MIRARKTVPRTSCTRPTSQDSKSLDERQRPTLQIQVPVRISLPLPKTVPVHAVLPEFGIARVQPLFASVMDSVAPIAVGGYAPDDRGEGNTQVRRDRLERERIRKPAPTGAQSGGFYH